MRSEIFFEKLLSVGPYNIAHKRELIHLEVPNKRELAEKRF